MPSFKVTVSDDAENDIDEAFLWYEIQKTGLGSDFIEMLEIGFKRVGNNPFRYQLIYKSIRRYLVSKFPYCIYYIVEPERTAVRVIAVLHSSRNPVIWKKRRKKRK